MNDLVAAIKALGQHDFLEIASWASQIVIAIVGIITAILVLVQVKEIAGDSAKQTKQLKANFLFDLDKLYESEAFTKTRLLFSEHAERVRKEVEAEEAHLDIDGKNKVFSDRFCQFLHKLKQEDHQNYHYIMKFAGFFETAGKLSHSGYITPNDVFDLYASAIKAYYRATELHIKKRRLDENMPELFEHFLHLGAEAEKWKTPH